MLLTDVGFFSGNGPTAIGVLKIIDV